MSPTPNQARGAALDPPSPESVEMKGETEESVQTTVLLSGCSVEGPSANALRLVSPDTSVAPRVAPVSDMLRMPLTPRVSLMTRPDDFEAPASPSASRVRRYISPAARVPGSPLGSACADLAKALTESSRSLPRYTTPSHCLSRSATLPPLPTHVNRGHSGAEACVSSPQVVHRRRDPLSSPAAHTRALVATTWSLPRPLEKRSSYEARSTVSPSYSYRTSRLESSASGRTDGFTLARVCDEVPCSIRVQDDRTMPMSPPSSSCAPAHPPRFVGLPPKTVVKQPPAVRDLRSKPRFPVRGG